MSRMPLIASLLIASSGLPASARDDKPAQSKSPVLAPAAEHKQQFVVVSKQSVKLEKIDARNRTIKVSYSVTEGLGRYAKLVEKSDELPIAEECKFRSLQLPETVDANGKVKKVTPEEIRKLKGTDPKLPGYAVEIDALAAGQQIEVTVSRHKEAAPKKKDKSAAAEKPAVFATLIVIQNDDRAQQPVKPGKR